MRLTDYEQEMLAGAHGEPRRFAIDQQIKVGRFFDAVDFVPVSQVHLMADGEALGAAGLDLLERVRAEGPEQSRFLVPTVTDPRSVDPALCDALRQPAGSREREDRISAALAAMGALLTNTCINYQTIMPPLMGEHVAFGDTGSVIYANSVCGARSNFEGGSAALWAALTGRVPRYGYHLDEARRATRVFRLAVAPDSLTDWGALGGLIGRRMGSYWDVPVVCGVERLPTSDELKHFGAALASYGSTALFHMVGVTPEARDLATVCGDMHTPAEVVDDSALQGFYDSFGEAAGKVDLVVFSAPQLSLFELETLAAQLDGAQVHPDVALIVTTSPETASAAERMGIADRIRRCGARLVQGSCFYQMYAREIGEANGWRRLVTNSAKLANIVSGYGYDPVLLPVERCVAAALTGRLA